MFKDKTIATRVDQDPEARLKAAAAADHRPLSQLFVSKIYASGNSNPGQRSAA